MTRMKTRPAVVVEAPEPTNGHAEPRFAFNASSPNVEAFLNHLGVKFQLRKRVPFGRVDWKRSLINHARFAAPLNRERVDAMVRQARVTTLHFDPLVFWTPTDDNARGLVVFNDGNHRGSAMFESGCPTFDGYELLDVGKATADLVTRRLNGFEGVGQTAEEVVRHAVDYARQNPTVPKADVAESFGIQPTLLGRKLRLAEYREKLGPDGDLTVTGHHRLADTALEAVLQIGNDVVIQAAVAGMSRLPKCDAEMAKQLVQAVKRAPKNEQAQLAAVAEQLQILHKVLESRRVTKGGVQRRVLAPHQRILTEMGRCVQALMAYAPDGTDPKDVFRTADARNSFRDLAGRLQSRLQKVRQTLPKDD